jgi:hypothetical protein
MGFSEEAGYIPSSFNTLMDEVRVEINTQFADLGANYTTESFVGSGLYKYMYGLVQLLQKNEVKTSEMFLKLQDYITLMNERISRPVVTNPGVIDKLESMGYIASLKPIVVGDAGLIHICVDTDDTADDYEDTRLDICNIIKDSTVAGCPTVGTEEETLVLSNGQSFDFKFNLPDRIPIILRLTIYLSENNLLLIKTPTEVRQILFDNISSRYRLGKNFEPQKYFSVVDAPWASHVLLEYSIDDGENWLSSVFDAEYDELYTFGLEDITIVEG